MSGFGIVFAATSSASELPHRLPSYAALAGMLAAKDADLGQQLVDGVAAAFAQRLEKLDTIPAKLLVRAAASVVARGACTRPQLRALTVAVVMSATPAASILGRAGASRSCDGWRSV